MTELVTEILAYLAVAAVLGLLLGYAIWGWGHASRLAAARAEGAASARTSVDGSADLKEQLKECGAEIDRLEREVATLRHRLEAQHAAAKSDTGDQAEDDPVAEVDPPETPDQTDEGGVRGEARGTAMPAEETPPAVARARILQPESVLMDTPGPATDVAADDLETSGEGAADQDLSDQDVHSESVPVVEEPAPAEPALPGPPPASLLAEKPDEVDDLKIIKGVGPKMEGILNEKGVYLFHQVANFSPQDVAWVNDAIEAFPGRIERDNWVAQAQHLYLKKYGRAHDAD